MKKIFIEKNNFIIIKIDGQTDLYKCILFNSTSFQLPILFFIEMRLHKLKYR